MTDERRTPTKFFHGGPRGLRAILPSEQTGTAYRQLEAR